MPFRKHLQHRIHSFRTATWWLPLASLIALLSGLLTAAFLYGLELVTTIRWASPWLVFTLPAIGVIIYLLYRAWGASSSKGNNLIIEQVHRPGAGVPFRMAPLVLLSTLLTHLGGGSAGREGTAVQIGGSLAGWIGRRWGTQVEDTPLLLCCGMAAGFGAVFGTPLAGAVFAIEVLSIGRSNYRHLIPCLYTASIADAVCTLCGIHHTHYVLTTPLPAQLYDWVQPRLLGFAAIAGTCFGLAALLFTRMLHLIKHAAATYIRTGWLRPVTGGMLLILLTMGFGLNAYLGLGVRTASGSGVSIVNAFAEGGATPLSWVWKVLLTAITLGSGFKGGEVTPLFFIGATLGNTLGTSFGAPVDLMAALGFLAVFAGASNTPLACIIMGGELFGWQRIPYYAVACVLAYECSGHQGIYSSQKLITPKRLNRLSSRLRFRRKSD